VDAKDLKLHRIAKQQHGVISYAQAESVGFNESAIRWRFDSGEWHRVLPRVARMFWADDTLRARCWAVSLWASAAIDNRRDWALSHQTAAALLGFDIELKLDVHVLVPGLMVPKHCDWLQRHRTQVKMHTVDVEGLTVTAPARTFIDLAATMAEQESERILRLALRCGQVTTAMLHAELRLRGSRGPAARLRKHLNSVVRV
jgi:hypothetical protein